MEIMRKFLEKAVSVSAALAFGAALVAVYPAAAFAQSTVPSYAQPLPPQPASHDQRISGSVTSFDGKYALQVHDDRGYIDNVELHQGTIINPTGLTLVPGMRVTIYGFPRDHHFVANEIDTPYHYAPAYVWGPPPPYWGFGFGWHRGYFGAGW